MDNMGNMCNKMKKKSIKENKTYIGPFFISNQKEYSS